MLYALRVMCVKELNEIYSLRIIFVGVACVSTSDVKSKISKVCSSVASSCLYLQTNQQERRNCFEEKIRNYQCTETPTVRNPPLLPYYNYTVLMLVFRLLYTELIILFPLGSVIRICCELSLALTACPCCNVPTTYLLFHGAQLCSGFGVIFCLLYSIVAKVLLLTVFSLCVYVSLLQPAGNRVCSALACWYCCHAQLINTCLASVFA